MKLILITVGVILAILIGRVALYKVMNKTSWRDAFKKVFEFFTDLF
jgi:hypothetical protein